MSGHSAEKDAREAVLGEIVHDRRAEPESGWFIVGVDGYFDVDNACWVQPEEGDAPWTTEYFHLFGTVQELIAEGPGLAANYAWAQRDTDVPRDITRDLPPGEVTR
jgi:hypothetical protein